MIPMLTKRQRRNGARVRRRAMSILRQKLARVPPAMIKGYELSNDQRWLLATQALLDSDQTLDVDESGFRR